MFRLSAFADEIDPDPEVQVRVLKECRIRFIELRSILKTNILDLTDHQVAELKSLLNRNSFAVSAIGSPSGKIEIGEPFEPQWQRFLRAIELAKRFETRNIRIFSYYLPEGASPEDWPRFRDEVIARLRRQAALAVEADVRLLH